MVGNEAEIAARSMYSCSVGGQEEQAEPGN